MVLGGIPRFVKGLKRMEVVLGSGEAGMKNGSALGVDWGNNVSRNTMHPKNPSLHSGGHSILHFLL